MTYKQLIERLQRASDEQLNNDVTVYDRRQNEYYATKRIKTANDGVLDDGHLAIVF